VKFGSLFLSIFRIAVAAFLALVAARMLPIDFSASGLAGLTRIAEFVARVLAAGVFYLVLCFLLRVEEVRLILSRFRRG
jgi:hypothetical protein